MNELISLKISESGNKTVSGRELHEFLETKEKFADWMQRKVNDYDFIENTDFVSFSEKSEKGGRPRIEYEITIEMAKELSMLENNDKGKEARKYFIQCEKVLKENVPKLSKEIQAIFVLDEKQQKLEKKIDDLENNMPLFNIDCEELQGAVRKQGVKILGGKNSKAYKDKSIRTKLYSDIQKEIKRQFGLQKSYKALKRSQLDIALDIVSKYVAPLVVENEITLINNQMSIVEE